MENEHYVDTFGAAKLTGIAPNTLRFWRMEKRGPRYIKPGGRKVVYAVDDLRAWMATQAKLVQGE